MELRYSIRGDDNRKKSKFSLDHIPRCPECNLICSLHLYQNENVPSLLYYCENKHNGNILLNQYITSYKKNSLKKEKCECNNKEENDLMYCTKCKKFTCFQCILKNHKPSNGHSLIDLSKFDSLCKIHFNSFCSYCKTCNMNICEMCNKEHEKHNLIGLSNIIISEELKKELTEQINELKFSISEIEVIKNDIIKKLNELKENIQNEIELAVILLETYEFELEQKNLNYYNTSNLIGLGNTFKQFYNDFQIKIQKAKEMNEIFDYFNTDDGEGQLKIKLSIKKKKQFESIDDEDEKNYSELLKKYKNNVDLLKKKIKQCNTLRKENKQLKETIEKIEKEK